MSLGISGRVAQQFQNSPITPLLALVGLLLGFFAIAITPKEEEPQIDVTFANIFIAMPGASAKEVEQLIATPAEQVLSEMAGVDDIFSVSQPGQAVLTVAFEVGTPRQEAIVRLYNQVESHNDWFPQNLGVYPPVIKPMGIDDVPIMGLTLSSKNPEITHQDLTHIAHVLETELKRVPGTRDIYTLGEHSEVLKVELDAARMNGHSLAFDDVRNRLQSANAGGQILDVTQNNQVIQIQAGQYLSGIEDLNRLIVAKNNSGLVYLSDVADISLQADTPEKHVFIRTKENPTSTPAVTIAIAKKPGSNAVDITMGIDKRLAELKNQVIPHDVEVTETRNYGTTAKAKSDQLMAKLLFATAAVIVLVLLTMSWREAVIVGSAIIITLAITLFASWAYGFTLNRVSLFALIFSIGILVDDAIVVVENIHRHMQNGKKSLLKIIPAAVDEVGGPTILATFTVIAALMPMAFVSGLMGPYMSPIPINASMGMLISLIVAFMVTPWLSYKLLKAHSNDHDSNNHDSSDSHSDEEHHHEQVDTSSKLYQFFNKIMRPMLANSDGSFKGQASRNRKKLLAFTMLLIAIAVSLPVMKLVVLKMLPFDNKSEFQIIVDMPEGTPVETTLTVLEALSEELMTVPEVKDIEMYAGTASPINFNGLVRQYYLRQEKFHGDLQVNLVDKSQRSRQSHDIAVSVRDRLQEVGKPFNANVKIVEVPPGPPVMAPIAAEIYGSNYKDQIEAAKKLTEVFKQTPDVVDVDNWVEAPQEKWVLTIDRLRAAALGIAEATIQQTIRTALDGENVSYIHSERHKYPLPVRLELPEAGKVELQQVLTLKVRNLNGKLIALSEVVSIQPSQREQTIYHKNLLPVMFVTADMTGELDSPLYGLFDIAFGLEDKPLFEDKESNMPQHYIAQPESTNQTSLKWDGEWQITYETFRDMGIAYAVGMILIYLLVVAQFHSYLVPLVIMAPIPLTVIGVMPGHALFGAQFTATSMIGMIALAGIIVRNSILLVDFINQQLDQGMDLVDAVINSAVVRSKPIVLTGIAAMVGAFFILDDPIFNGLAIALIFGILVSTALTLIIIPVLYFSLLRRKLAK